MTVLVLVVLCGWLANVLLAVLISRSGRRSRRLRRGASYAALLKKYDFGVSVLAVAWVLVIALCFSVDQPLSALDAEIDFFRTAKGVILGALAGPGLFVLGLLVNPFGSVNWNWRRLMDGSLGRLICSSCSEEILWRGPLIVWSVWQCNDFSLIALVVLGTLLFGVLHYSGDWRQPIYMACFALVAMLLTATCGLLAAVLMHFSYNCVRVVARVDQSVS